MGDKGGVRRGNRRSSSVQSKHSEDHTGNEAMKKMRMSIKGMKLDHPVTDQLNSPPVPRPPEYRNEMGSMSAVVLVELQKVFKAANSVNEGDLLDQETFLKTCMTIKTLTALLSQEQLKHLYMKVDVNSKGEIGFDDFTSYLLSQQLAKENAPAPEQTTFVKVATFGSKKGRRRDYEDSESGPSDEEKEKEEEQERRRKRRAEGDYTRGQKKGDLKTSKPGNTIEKIMLLEPLNLYVTSSQDGMLKLWRSDTLKPKRTFQNGSGAWITDMVVMAQQPMAVFALDRSVTFYDTGRMSFDCLGRITALENAPMCATWLRAAENDQLLFGDDLGILHTYTFNDEWGGEHPREGFGVSDVKKLPPGMSEDILPWTLHTDWVTSIKYLAHSNSLITTGMDGCLLMLDFEKRQQKWSAKEHANGIYACDYSRSRNFIVTCGLERHINIWSPYTAKTVETLHGHEASVTDVQVNETDNQILSISADSKIKVWDVRSSRCLETIVESTNTNREPSRVNIYFDSVKQILLAGGDKLEMWQKKRAREARTALIAAMVYNPLFRQVVVGEVDSVVMVWSLDTGEDIFTFSDTQRKTKITCMAFDASWRRLVIGAQDGSLRFWNFNNGQPLKELAGWGPYEITCVVCMEVAGNISVAAGGWKKKVCTWTDTVGVEVERVERNMRGHADDVTCICFCAPTTIVTGGCDGKVIVWKMDGSIMRTMTPSDKRHGDSPDNKIIVSIVFLGKLARSVVVSVADGWLRFWRLQDGQLVHELFTENRGKVGPIAADAKCTMLFSADSKGYVKSWDLTTCHFEEESTLKPSSTALVSEIRAHHELLVSMVFIDEDNLLLTCSQYGTVRLWNAVGARVGQFGQHALWNLKMPSTWSSREPSYLIHPLARQEPEGVFSAARTPTREVTVARPESEAKESDSAPAPAPIPKPSEEDLKRQYEAKKKAVLDSGPPQLRLESWYTPLANAFERQLATKNLSPLLPLVPSGLSDIAAAKAEMLEAPERRTTP